MLNGNTKKTKLLQKIANHLILHVNLLDNLGLYYGKMGIVIFLYHYAKFTDNKIIADFADELLEDILNKINHELTFDFVNGYCGIGWSIEYLLHNNFVQGNSNEILIEIDNKIMEWDVRRIIKSHEFCSVEGLLHYVVFRLYRCEKDNTPFDSRYIEDMYVLSSEIQKIKLRNSISEMASIFLSWKNGEKIIYCPDKTIRNILIHNNQQQKELANIDLGLKQGCAGIALNIIFNET